MIIADELLKLSVRIEQAIAGCNNQRLGSGIWWQPNDTSDYLYIFTAAHVVQNKENIIIKYIDTDGGEQEVEIDDINVACHMEPTLNDGELPSKDVAVLRCMRNSIVKAPSKTYKLHSIDNVFENREMILRGFPESLFNPSSLNSSNKLANVTLENKDNIKKRFTYRFAESLGVNHYEANEQIVGFSGAGMFFNSNNELLLLGIKSSSLGENAALNSCVGMYSELIIDICENRNWDIPIMASSVVGNLEDCIENFCEEIENDELYDIMRGLIECDFERVIRSKFCGISKDCENDTCPHQCQTFRNFLLIIICVLKYLNNSIDLENPCITSNEINIPVKYICCDGEASKSRVALSSFIRSLKEDYLIKNKLEEKTLILWGTKKSIRGTEKSCNANRFKKIIRDIKAPYERKRGFDIKKGLNQTKDLSIIELNALLEKINEDTLDDMVGFIEENIKN